MSSNQQANQCKDEGDSFYRAKKYPLAVMKYTQAINLLHPQGLTPSDDAGFQTLYVSYSNRCACFLQVNRIEQALEDAKQCVKLKPDWVKGYMRLGTCYHRLNKISDALAAYQQLLRVDPTHQEAQQCIQRLRQQQNRPSGSSSTHTQGTDHANRQPPHNDVPFLQRAQQYLQSIRWQDYFRSIQLQFSRLYAQFMMWWSSLSPDMQKYIQIGAIVLVAYYFLFYRSGSSYDYYPREYGYGSGGGGYYSSGYGGGGLSWTMWGAIMLAAYKLPPMFEEQLGPQYARPFFGMSWTTFMWLLNMVTRNSGHLGGFGRPMYGRRRYY